MLHVYYGTDRQGVRDAAAKLLAAHTASDTTPTVIDSHNYQPGLISDALGASSLFGGDEWFIVDTPSDNADLAEAVQKHLAEMEESPNAFIILESTLLAAAKKLYTKHAQTVEEFTAAKEERFNTFAMADALAQKDRRQLWVLLQQAKGQGLAAEEIIGMLWWQLKALRLADTTSNAAEAGMKDFPYNKAKRSLAKFAPGEVTHVSQSLLQLYHDGHAGVRDIDLALEQWVLGGT